MTDAKALILRRRARFLASALGGLAAVGVAPAAHAIEADSPKAPVPGTEPFALDDVVGCVGNDAPTQPVAIDIAQRLEHARTLYRKGDRLGALTTLRRARENVAVAAMLELEAEIELQAGRPATARALLEARTRCPDKEDVALDPLLMKRIEDVRSRTAMVSIQGARSIMLDGVPLRNTNGVVYLEPGSHTFEIETFDGTKTTRALAFAGGEKETIELPGGEPRVCLSIALPHNNREDAGPFGVTIAPTMMIDVAGANGGPLTVGGAIAPFGRLALSRSSEFRLGASIAPSGSSRGFTMPAGAMTSVRFYPGSVISIGLGASGGWLVAPSPSRSTIGAFEPAPSPFVEPHIPITLSIGSVEIEHKIGMVVCGQEDAERSRFAPSYVSLSLGLTLLPFRSSRFDD